MPRRKQVRFCWLKDHGWIRGCEEIEASGVHTNSNLIVSQYWLYERQLFSFFYLVILFFVQGMLCYCQKIKEIFYVDFFLHLNKQFRKLSKLKFIIHYFVALTASFYGKWHLLCHMSPFCRKIILIFRIFRFHKFIEEKLKELETEYQ